MEAILTTILALVIVGVASDLIVDSAVALSVRFGLPKVVVGVVVLGYASGLPELTASAIASYKNLGGVALGSVIGSNTINATLVISAGAIIAPIILESKLIAREGIIAISTTLLFTIAAFLGMGRPEAFLEILAFIVVTFVLIKGSAATVDRELESESGKVERELALARLITRFPPALVLSVGLIAMIAGAQLLINGVVGLISEFHIQQGVAGAIILATGATLPELFNSIAAARRNESEILVGNVFGEIIFNSTIVGGFAGVFHAGTLTHAMKVGPLFIMLACVLATTILLIRGRSIGRNKSVVLLMAYVVALATITFS